jgi:hypothetical protein
MTEREPTEAEWAAQQAEWEDWAAGQLAKGLCEFSGLRVSDCVGSICDCFETPEGAAEIERKAGLR